MTDFRNDTTFDDSSRGGRGQVYFVQIQVELRALDPFADVVQILAQQEDAIEQTTRGQMLHAQNGEVDVVRRRSSNIVIGRGDIHRAVSNENV